MTARDSALQRGHVLPEHPVRLPDGARVWECTECPARLIAYQQETYGGALERDCVGRVA